MTRYALGPAANPTLVLGDTALRSAYGPAAVDSYGVAWMIEHPSGWDDVEFKTPTDEINGADGALIGPQSIGPRTLSISGTLIAPDRAGAVAALRRLRAALPRRGNLVFTLTEDDGLALYVDTVPTGSLKASPVSGRAVIFSFALICKDPIKRALVTQTMATGLPIPGAQSGYSPPFTPPLVFTSGAITGGSVWVTNKGDAPAWPTVTIDGPVATPAVANDTSGLYAQWGITLPYQSRMVVDFRTGLVTVNGIPTEVPLVGYGSGPWPIQPGQSSISWRSRAPYDAAAQLAVAWQDTYQ